MENSNKAPSCTITSSGCLMIIIIIILLCICESLDKLVRENKSAIHPLIDSIENTK